MKTVNTIIKIVTALAAIAGAVYVIATYGDKIVAWAKKMLGYCQCECCCDCEDDCDNCPCEGDCNDCDCVCDCDCCCEEVEEAPAEEAAPAVEEEVIEEVIVEAGEPVADEADFAE